MKYLFFDLSTSGDEENGFVIEGRSETGIIVELPESPSVMDIIEKLGDTLGDVISLNYLLEIEQNAGPGGAILLKYEITGQPIGEIIPEQ